MAAFTFLYGDILVLALILGGLVYMVSPPAGQQVIKRVGASVLLFWAGANGLHYGSASLLGSTAMVVAGGLLLVASLLWIVDPTGASELIRRVVVFTLASTAAYAVLKWLCMDRTGRLVTGVLILVLLIALFVRVRSS